MERRADSSTSVTNDDDFERVPGHCLEAEVRDDGSIRSDLIQGVKNTRRGPVAPESRRKGLSSKMKDEMTPHGSCCLMISVTATAALGRGAGFLRR